MSERLLTILQKLKTKHYECDDCYYSCPKCEEGCCNEYAEDECNCGADEQNALVDEAMNLLSQLTAELAEWRADAERLAKSFVIEVYPHEWVCRSGCHHMGKTPGTIEHSPDCPIKLHRELVAKYGGEK